MWWHTVTQEKGSEGETGEWNGWPVPFTLPRNTVYPALLPLMHTPRLPVDDDLNGHVLFAERRNLVSASVPSHFNRPLTICHVTEHTETKFSWQVACKSCFSNDYRNKQHSLSWARTTERSLSPSRAAIFPLQFNAPLLRTSHLVILFIRELVVIFFVAQCILCFI